MAMLRSNRRDNIVDSRLKVSLGWGQCCEGMRESRSPPAGFTPQRLPETWFRRYEGFDVYVCSFMSSVVRLRCLLSGLKGKEEKEDGGVGTKWDIFSALVEHIGSFPIGSNIFETFTARL